MRMWEVTQEIQLAIAHKVMRTDAQGTSERLHGHNWRVVAVVRAGSLNDDGLVVDVEELGSVLREVTAPYDHALLNDVAPFDRIVSTAERFAHAVAEKLAERIDDERVKVARIEVWEGYIRKATYFRDVP
jgi:6-pyruvoyltetrahydropterin/6-carboxytetrahydropterin synthase